MPSAASTEGLTACMLMHFVYIVLKFCDTNPLWLHSVLEVLLFSEL